MVRRTLLAAFTLALLLVGSADSVQAQVLNPTNNYGAGGYGNRWYGYGGMGYGNPHYYGNGGGSGNYNAPSPTGMWQSSYAPRYPLYHSPNPGYFVPGIHYGYGPYNYSFQPSAPLNGPAGGGFGGPIGQPYGFGAGFGAW